MDLLNNKKGKKIIINEYETIIKYDSDKFNIEVFKGNAMVDRYNMRQLYGQGSMEDEEYLDFLYSKLEELLVKLKEELTNKDYNIVCITILQDVEFDILNYLEKYETLTDRYKKELNNTFYSKYKINITDVIGVGNINDIPRETLNRIVPYEDVTPHRLSEHLSTNTILKSYKCFVSKNWNKLNASTGMFIAHEDAGSSGNCLIETINNKSVVIAKEWFELKKKE